MWRAAAGSKATSPSICWLTLACHGFEVAPLKQSRNWRKLSSVYSFSYIYALECVLAIVLRIQHDTQQCTRPRAHAHAHTHAQVCLSTVCRVNQSRKACDGLDSDRFLPILTASRPCVSALPPITNLIVLTQGLVESNHNEPQPAETQTKAHACPTPGEPWVVLPPIHSCVRPADHGGKFFVLCFQPVTVPCALCAQVTRASARETMATADSGSARDRHWKSRARRAPRTVQAYSPHSGDRRARPRPGTALEGSHLRAG